VTPSMSGDVHNILCPALSSMVSQFLRYAGAGAFGTAAHYAILIALVILTGVGAVTASTAGAIAGALVNYAVNHRFTFASRRAHRTSLPRFFAVAGVGVLLNAAIMTAMLAVLPLHYLVAQAAATVVVLALGFVVNRKWTF